MTNITNEQLEALLNEATPGPWVAKGRYIGTPSHMSYVAEVRDQNGNWSDTAKSRRDAALIAAAPALAATLLAERKAREVEVGELKRLQAERDSAILWIHRLANNPRKSSTWMETREAASNFLANLLQTGKDQPHE